MSATNTKSLVDRLANDDLKENYALKVFPPILLMIMLSNDDLNPVKMCVPPGRPRCTRHPHCSPHALTACSPPRFSFCVYTGMETQHCFWVLVLTLIVMSFLERMAVAYYATRAFLQAIQTVFFNSVDVIGVKNIPLDGPVIFVGNHCNQFADGIMLIMNARRKVITERCSSHVKHGVRVAWAWLSACACLCVWREHLYAVAPAWLPGPALAAALALALARILALAPAPALTLARP